MYTKTKRKISIGDLISMMITCSKIEPQGRSADCMTCEFHGEANCKNKMLEFASKSLYAHESIVSNQPQDWHDISLDDKDEVFALHCRWEEEGVDKKPVTVYGFICPNCGNKWYSNRVEKCWKCGKKIIYGF